MKGFQKGVNFRTSATKHFADGGRVEAKPRPKQSLASAQKQQLNDDLKHVGNSLGLSALRAGTASDKDMRAAGAMAQKKETSDYVARRRARIGDKPDVTAAMKAEKYAAGGSVNSDYTPGANREANLRDGFAPDLPKAARDDIEKRFGKTPPKSGPPQRVTNPKAAKPVTQNDADAMKALRKKSSAGQPVKETAGIMAHAPKGSKLPARIGNLLVEADKIKEKIEPVKKARGGGILGQVAAKMVPAGRNLGANRPAPAANARAVPGHKAVPMFGRGSALQNGRKK